MQVLLFILTVALFIPFVGWGIYTLRLRYRNRVELPLALEAITIVGLVAFYAFELALLRATTPPTSVYFTLALLGLFMSGAALYGPMVISLASQALVDQVMPAERSKTSEPSYVAATARERVGDYEGAIHEYKVVAKMFPRDPVAMIRIADNLMKLAEPELAAPWFECGLRCLESPEKILSVTNRLVEVYVRDLGRPERAVRILEDYLACFPDTRYAMSVRQRLEKLTKAPGES